MFLKEGVSLNSTALHRLTLDAIFLQKLGISSDQYIAFACYISGVEASWASETLQTLQTAVWGVCLSCKKTFSGNQSTLQNAEALLNVENKNAFPIAPKEFTESS